MKGSVFYGTSLVLRLKRTDKNTCFGVSIPKKIAKTAVLRHSIKRQIYSAIRPLLSRTIDGFNVVIVAKAEILKLSFSEISEEIEKIFVKSNILK